MSEGKLMYVFFFKAGSWYRMHCFIAFIYYKSTYLNESRVSGYACGI